MAVDEARETVDGMPVRVGSVVWRTCPYAAPRRRTLDRNDLSGWWSMLREQIYSTERAALVGAIARERQALKKAKQEVRRATKAIERLSARFAGHTRKASP